MLHPWYNGRSFAITPKGAVLISFIDAYNPPTNYIRLESNCIVSWQEKAVHVQSNHHRNLECIN